MNKKCAFCGIDIVHDHFNRKYCSGSCRQKAYRVRVNDKLQEIQKLRAENRRLETEIQTIKQNAGIVSG